MAKKKAKAKTSEAVKRAVAKSKKRAAAKLNPLKSLPEEIVRFGPNPTLTDLETGLGQVSYMIGKQSQVVNEEAAYLKQLQQAANIIATEMEKHDG